MPRAHNPAGGLHRVHRLFAAIAHRVVPRLAPRLAPRHGPARPPDRARRRGTGR